jgi:hypothetical protein
LRWGPWDKNSNCKWVPARPWQRPAGRLWWCSRRQRAFRRGGWAKHDLRDSVSTPEGGTLEGWQLNLAVDEKVRQPHRSSSVPGEGPANAGKGSAHEHQWEVGSRSVYLGEPEIRRRELPTVRSGSAAPVKGGSGWEQFRRRGGRGWTSSGRRASGGGGEATG